MSNTILAIGIDKYKNCKPLNNAVRDINNILETLTTKYDFEKTSVVTLLDEKATLENIINELEIQISKQSAGDNLLILFSGHGDYDEILEMGYLIPYESVPFSKSTYLPYSTLFSYVKALKSHHILLISDSCYSGSIFNPVRSIETSKEKLDKIPSKWAITSGRLELVSDGDPGKNSPFAEALLKILNETTENLTSVSELANKLVMEVAGKVDQIPRGEPLQSYGHKGGEFIFRKKISEKKEETKREKLDYSTRKETLELINSHYELEEKIEFAENENKAGTIRRLNQEKDSLRNILNKELIKELEIKRNSILKHKDSLEILPKEYFKKHEELLEARKEKNEFVKQQKYEPAAMARDKEKKFESELTNILDLSEVKNKLTFSKETLYKDYFIIQLLLDSRYDIKFEKKQLIEQIFARLLFHDISFDKGNLSPYVYKDSRDKLVNALMEQI